MFLKQVVATRHYHVHSNVKDEDFVVKDVIELSRINKKLEIIIQAILMIELGFEQGVINERLKKTDHLIFIIYKCYERKKEFYKSWSRTNKGINS